MYTHNNLCIFLPSPHFLSLLFCTYDSYTYICKYIYIYIYTYTCTYICVYVCVYIHAFIIYMYMSLLSAFPLSTL